MYFFSARKPGFHWVVPRNAYWVVRICLVLSAGLCVGAQEREVPLLLHLKIAAPIDVRAKRYLKLGLEEARDEKKIVAVILELNTYGGGLYDADEMRQSLLDFEKPVYAFVNKNAASAGALLSIACDSIYMSAGASLGAATVVNEQGKAAPDKYQSYMRAMMRSTAEAQGRDPAIAEAMVDESLSVDSVSQAGKVLSLSTKEALQLGFCEAQMENISAVAERTHGPNAQTRLFTLKQVDKIIAFFINPLLSGLLILGILGGLYYELQTPGLGFAGLIALLSLLFYLLPYYISGLATYWEIAMLCAGVALLLVEVFVLPGFGIAGLAGIATVLTSLVFIMLNNEGFDFAFVPAKAITQATLSVSLAALFNLIWMVFAAEYFPRTALFKRITLQKAMLPNEGFVSGRLSPKLLHAEGISYTVLRPSGKVQIENQVYEAREINGMYIPAQTAIVVVGVERHELRVKRKVA